MPHVDDLYRNISLLGVAVAEDDVVMMYKLIKDGCDLTYNDTAILFMFDEDDMEWGDGITLLHIASMEGSAGKNKASQCNTKLLETNQTTSTSMSRTVPRSCYASNLMP